MKRWSEKFEALPDTRIKVINEKRLLYRQI